MTVLQLTYAPNPIFKQQSSLVTKFDQTLTQLVNDMFETIAYEQAVGMAAPMVGILKRIIVIDIKGDSKPLAMINPEITAKSAELQTFEEASLCFIGVSAPVNRSSTITVQYQDLEGKICTMEAEGFLATVIQHEIDYLNGIVFLDHLSKMKRDLLLKKMEKYLKMHPPHVHGAHCNH